MNGLEKLDDVDDVMQRIDSAYEAILGARAGAQALAEGPPFDPSPPDDALARVIEHLPTDWALVGLQAFLWTSYLVALGLLFAVGFRRDPRERPDVPGQHVSRELLQARRVRVRNRVQPSPTYQPGAGLESPRAV